jgi:hypothetical protein
MAIGNRIDTINRRETTMSNYFDNQSNWSWNVDPGKSVAVTTNH